MRKLLASILALALFIPAPLHAATGTVAPAPVFTGFDDTGTICVSCKLYTYLAGTSTPQNTYSEVTLTSANANPVVLNSAGRAVVYLLPTSYKFILKTSADVTIWTQDNVGAVPVSNINIDIVGTAGETIAAGDALYLSDGSGGTTAGRWYLTDSDQTYSSVLAIATGFAVAAIATAASGSIRVGGRVSDLSGLAVGSVYYVSATAGAVTSTAPANARTLGQADSTTTLVIASSTPPFATETVSGIVSTTTQTFGGAKTFAGATNFTGLSTFTVAPLGLFRWARTTANFTKNNNTTPADVTGLAISVAANEVLDISCVLHVQMTVVSGLKMQFTGPAAPTAVRFGAAAGGLVATADVSAFSATFNASPPVAGTWQAMVLVRGIVRNGANAGTIQLQAAQNTGEVLDTIIYAESTCSAFRQS